MAYRGVTVPLPIGSQGFNGARNPSKLGPGHFSYAEGVDLDGGILLKDGGATKFNGTVLGSGATIRSGINWSPAAGIENDVVLLSTGAALKDTGAGTFGITLRTGLSDLVEPPPIFVAAGGETVGATRKLFLFSLGHQVQVVLGIADTMAAISTPAADWASSFPAAGVLHKNRLWAFGNGSDPHRLYYSQEADHQNFTGSGAGTIAVHPGEGNVIAGAVSFRGLLIVWKYPRGIYYVDTRDPLVANWRVDRVTLAVGGINQQCIVPIENDVLYLDASGNLHRLSATSDLGDLNTSNISQASNQGTFMRAEVSLTNIRRAVGLWHSNKRKAVFFVPRSGASVNNLRIMVDFNDEQMGPRFLLSRRDVGVSLWLRPAGDKIYRPAIGDDTGFVRTLDQDARNKDGVAYDMDFETANTDFSFAEQTLSGKVKNGEFIEIELDLLRQTTLTVTPVWDGLPAEVLLFSIGFGAVGLGTFQLDTHALGDSGTVVVRRRLPGAGRNLKLRFFNNVLDDELRISAVRVGVMVADERTNPHA